MLRIVIKYIVNRYKFRNIILSFTWQIFSDSPEIFFATVSLLSSTTLLKLRPISLAVPGMNCHNPIAPAGEIAFGFNEDSMTEIILSSTGRLYLLSAWSKKGKYMVALPNKCSDVVR